MTKAQGPRPEACQCRGNNGPKCAGQTGPNKDLDKGDSTKATPAAWTLSVFALWAMAQLFRLR